MDANKDRNAAEQHLTLTAYAEQVYKEITTQLGIELDRAPKEKHRGLTNMAQERFFMRIDRTRDRYVKRNAAGTDLIADVQKNYAYKISEFAEEWRPNIN